MEFFFRLRRLSGISELDVNSYICACGFYSYLYLSKMSLSLERNLNFLLIFTVRDEMRILDSHFISSGISLVRLQVGAFSVESLLFTIYCFFLGYFFSEY